MAKVLHGRTLRRTRLFAVRDQRNSSKPRAARIAASILDATGNLRIQANAHRTLSHAAAISSTEENTESVRQDRGPSCLAQRLRYARNRPAHIEQSSVAVFSCPLRTMPNFYFSKRATCNSPMPNSDPNRCARHWPQQHFASADCRQPERPRNRVRQALHE